MGFTDKVKLVLLITLYHFLALISYGHYQNNISHSLNKSLKFLRRIQKYQNT